MVKLLHHYETVSNRIFLLLEHIKNGRLVDHVQSIRGNQMGKRLREKEERRRRKREKRRKVEGEELARVVIGQESSSNTISPVRLSPDVSGESPNTSQSPISLPHSHGSPVAVEPYGNEDKSGTRIIPSNPSPNSKTEEDYIQYLMENLTPPTEIPITSSPESSMGGGGGGERINDGGKISDEEDEEEVDVLEILRKQMDELCREDEDKGKRDKDNANDDSVTIETETLLDGEEEDNKGEEDNELMGREESEEQLLELEKHLTAFTSLSVPDSDTNFNLENQDTTSDTTAPVSSDTAAASSDTGVASSDTGVASSDTGVASSDTGVASSNAPVTVPVSSDRAAPVSSNITDVLRTNHSSPDTSNEDDNTHKDNVSTDQTVCNEEFTSTSTTINVVPPTPTTPTSQPCPIPAKPSGSHLVGGEVSKSTDEKKK